MQEDLSAVMEDAMCRGVGNARITDTVNSNDKYVFANYMRAIYIDQVRDRHYHRLRRQHRSNAM